MKRILFALTLVMTALNATFCSKQTQTEGNPLLTEFNTPYGVPPFDQIKAEHYEPAFKFAMSLHNDEVAAILANRRSRPSTTQSSSLTARAQCSLPYLRFSV